VNCRLAAAWLRAENGAAPGERRHVLAQRAHLDGVEAVGGLVEHEHGGIAHQRLREHEPLAHARRVGLDLAVDGRAEPGELEARLERRRRPRSAAGAPQQPEVAPAAQVRDERRPVD
jgi:hypothetical protein